VGKEEDRVMPQVALEHVISKNREFDFCNQSTLSPHQGGGKSSGLNELYTCLTSCRPLHLQNLINER
jgi:hypothetical protein